MEQLCLSDKFIHRVINLRGSKTWWPTYFFLFCKSTILLARTSSRAWSLSISRFLTLSINSWICSKCSWSSAGLLRISQNEFHQRSLFLTLEKRFKSFWRHEMNFTLQNLNFFFKMKYGASLPSALSFCVSSLICWSRSETFCNFKLQNLQLRFAT